MASERPDPRVRLHIDASRGIAGDMLLAALIDLGVPEEAVIGPLARLPAHSVEFGTTERRGIRVRTVAVTARESTPPHRHLREVEELIEALDLPGRARESALACFRRIAAAEGAVHGIDPAAVHFHEIGAIDSLVDIIGCCLAVAILDPVEVSCSSLPLGSGTVRTAHGVLPVPAPATLRLLAGLPTHPYPVGREVTTPTGAALAATLADRFGDPPAGTIVRDGSGAGGRIAPPEDPPNVLRAWTTAADDLRAPLERVVLLESNLDTVTGEEAGDAIGSLLGQGALDAWATPVIGKKGRPGLILSALAAPAAAGELRRAIFRLTGTLGVRQRELDRETLPREVVELPIEGRTVRVKRAWLDGTLISERPEYEDLARLAREQGLPLREVRATVDAALRRRREDGLGPGSERGPEDDRGEGGRP